MIFVVIIVLNISEMVEAHLQIWISLMIWDKMHAFNDEVLANFLEILIVVLSMN